mmetsp:Transcript_7366/g.12380  ORF Transcript_7366/g.12380 Transcript_7366/m.12380 type:complete len:522 (+) Transcript_7366:80-1645(+)
MSGVSAAPSSSSTLATVATKSGWLVKQGHIFRTWKKRWFVLEGPLLKYFKTGTDGPNNSSEPPTLSEMKGCITLLNCTVKSVSDSEADGRPFAFEISPMSKKIFLICAPDEAARTAWVEAIKVAATLRPGSASQNQISFEHAAVDPDPNDVKNCANGGEATVSLGDFELLKVIGRGTYGKVMQVKLKGTSDIYAMKVLKKENIFARNDPKDLQHTIAERNVLALVNNSEHPFILGLKFAFHTPAKLYYVLNFCNGGDLYYLLSRCKKFKEPQARFYAGEVFLAIQHLHGLGVIYRDLKPENVLLDSDGHVKLTDFGLSKESETAETFCGTPVYLAPEIWLRKTYGFEVDWWSLGCVLFEMVCGLPPFWGDTIKDVYKKVINTQPKFPQMSADCQSLIEGLLTREAPQRLGSKENGEDIKRHDFFAHQSWDDLFSKNIKPPFKSKSGNQEDTNNFHKAFTNQRPIDSVANASLLDASQQANFDGFTYVPKPGGGNHTSTDFEELSISEKSKSARASRYTQPS